MLDPVTKRRRRHRGRIRVIQNAAQNVNEVSPTLAHSLALLSVPVAREITAKHVWEFN